MVGISVLTVFFFSTKEKEGCIVKRFIVIFMCSKLEFYLELFSQSMR